MAEELCSEQSFLTTLPNRQEFINIKQGIGHNHHCELLVRVKDQCFFIELGQHLYLFFSSRSKMGSARPL